MLHNCWYDHGDAWFKKEPDWYPGHPCYMGRFLLVLKVVEGRNLIEKETRSAECWDLDKGYRVVVDYDDLIAYYMPVVYRK